MQARSQLCYKAAIWERSANPAANVRSRGRRTERLPAAGGRGGAGGAGWCQPASASAGEIRPAARLLGSVLGSGITLHRCANSSSAQHLCLSHPLLWTHRWRRAFSSSLSGKSDRNKHW
ncbi:unnamed protein product [Pleuronectes platessa]|uniref:Uncharacterized protein n=1 Tax=Pleuronectes platessa TaxID=8262 RepID=A0A9N7Z7J7_PLEPL|nr:unnamed protein product [Pleuronectes platessa]